jgi:hypothetical protein
MAPSEAEASFAGEQTGNELLALCTNEQSSFEQGLCHGFIAGAIQRDQIVRFTNPESAWVCAFPQSADNGQIKEIVVSYLPACAS